MNKIAFFLTLAQNGLKVAANFLHSKAKKEVAEGKLEECKKSESLADILDAADAGIQNYLINSED